MIMQLIVQCFSVNDLDMAKENMVNVIWLSTIWFLIFRLEVANKKPLFTTKPASISIEISFWKDKTFHSYKILCIPHPQTASQGVC